MGNVINAKISLRTKELLKQISSNTGERKIPLLERIVEREFLRTKPKN